MFITKFYDLNGNPRIDIKVISVKFTGISIETDGTFWRRCYRKNGLRHRLDGPASEDSYGNKIWLIEGKLHRENGPAVEYSNNVTVYYINDEQVTEEQHKLYIDLMKLRGLS